jgi:hypothetical protein
MNFVKVNWEGVVDKENRKMGIRVTIRDYEWEVLATLIAPKQHIIDLVIAEATMALRVVMFIVPRTLIRVK